MKRLLTIFAYRHSYRFHKRVLHWLYWISALLALLANVFMYFAIHYRTYSNYTITSFVLYVFTIIAALAVIVYSRIVAAAKAEFEITKEYFTEETYVYNEPLIKRMTNHSLKDKKSPSKVVIAVLVVRGLHNIRTTFGQQGVKTVNSAIREAISENTVVNENSAYGFNPIKGFLIFKRTNDIDGFIQDVKKITDSVNQKLEDNSTLPNVSILTGLSVSEQKSTYDDLIEKAQVASTYNLSTRITSDTIIYNDELMTDQEGERVLSIELGNAINEEQLQIYYQPKFKLKENKFYGAEALVRWNHPSRGLLPPSLFIPFAEQSNRIIDIDMYVFDHVCRDIVKWRKEGKRILTISINLSRKTTLDPNIITFYKETMERYEIDPRWIDIELTESMAAQDTLFTASIIRKIKDMNMETSIDDFGTGYSSFSSLKKIPFDTLKIDKSFVDEIELDEKSRSLVKSINDIGHSLDMKTLAEGIETETQVKIAREIGIDSIQGYYFSKPLSEFEYQRFLTNNEFEHPVKKGVKA